MKHPKRYDTDEATSRRMSRVKLKHGEHETRLAKRLWREGYRYWLNYKKLPGSPDIAIKRYRIAVFIDGEFWHGYDWERKKAKLKRNRGYWTEKIEENMKRDARVDRQLLAAGWVPVRFWSRDVEKDVDGCVRAINELVFDDMMNGYTR